jgi:hypothetical protein
LSSHRPTICGKKWWWPLFINGLNISIVAACRLYCRLHPVSPPSHLDFRRDITLCLLKGTTSRRRQGVTTRCLLPVDVRYDAVGHIIIQTTQGRCVMCRANTTSQCQKCGVRLHYARGSQCFNTYHTPI